MESLVGVGQERLVFIVDVIFVRAHDHGFERFFVFGPGDSWTRVTFDVISA